MCTVLCPPKVLTGMKRFAIVIQMRRIEGASIPLHEDLCVSVGPRSTRDAPYCSCQHIPESVE